jgi:hypothetical protein
MSRTSLIAFSKDRPMQCDLLLKSFKDMAGDYSLVDQYVLYDASSIEYEKSYDICKSENASVNFIKQDFFYKDLKRLLENVDSSFYLFCTDDTIFIRNFLIDDIETMFDNNDDLLNFSLRLGKNTIYCYSLLSQQKAPKFKKENGVLMWDWRGAEYDFGYPLEVSSSVLRAKDVKKFIQSAAFLDPNQMEWFMDMAKSTLVDRYTSASYRLSVAFSAPMNKVKKTNTNRASENFEYSIERLNEVYNNGYRINSRDFYKFVPRGAHQEVGFNFIEKKG